MYKVNHILRWFVWYVLYHMRNGWMEEKLGEDRSDSFVAMRLEKLKIKDPINSFRRCPFYLFLSVQHPKICWSRSCLFHVGRGLKQDEFLKKWRIFKTIFSSCMEAVSWPFFEWRSYVLIHESARQRNIGLSSLLFISLTTDLQCSTMNEGRQSIFSSQERLDVVLSIVPFHIALKSVIIDDRW